MKIRYILKDNEKTLTSVYELKDLENESLIRNIKWMRNHSIKIVRRDISTEKYTSETNTLIFENDFVKLANDEIGKVIKVAGGFEVNSKPLQELEILYLVGEEDTFIAWTN